MGHPIFSCRCNGFSFPYMEWKIQPSLPGLARFFNLPSTGVLGYFQPSRHCRDWKSLLPPRRYPGFPVGACGIGELDEGFSERKLHR
jgi:hypothetical protein